MTTDELFIELEDKPRDTVIVTLKYKYDFEENYTIENQILEYDGRDDTYVWLNDWYEGQTYIEVLGYTFLRDVDTIKPFKSEIIKSAIRFLVQKQIDRDSWGYADDDGTAILWDEVLEWLEQKPKTEVEV